MISFTVNIFIELLLSIKDSSFFTRLTLMYPRHDLTSLLLHNWSRIILLRLITTVLFFLTFPIIHWQKRPHVLLLKLNQPLLDGKWI